MLMPLPGTADNAKPAALRAAPVQDYVEFLKEGSHYDLEAVGGVLGDVAERLFGSKPVGPFKPDPKTGSSKEVLMQMGTFVAWGRNDKGKRMQAQAPLLQACPWLLISWQPLLLFELDGSALKH